MKPIDGEQTPTDTFFRLTQVTKTYRVRQGKHFHALEGITLDLRRGAAYAIVGESGSGKTTLGRILAGLVPVTEGEVFFEGKELSSWIRNDRKHFCKKVQMIFQNPYLSLDPKWSVGAILEEGIRELRPRQRKEKTREMMERVHLPEGYLRKKPQALSGGERQRVAIARSLLVEPEYLILDEPTSQLDVATQAGIMKLLGELKTTLRGGLLFITHDLALASDVADELIVLREGKVLEKGPKKEVLLSASHVYTQTLLAAIPRWPPVWG